MAYQVAVEEAARQLGVSGRQVRALLERGKLSGEKVSLGASWAVYQVSVDAYARNRKKPGRPQRSKK